MKTLKKILFLIGIVSVFAGCSSAKNKNGWFEDFDEAKKTAQSQNKPILLFVHSIYDDPVSKNTVEALSTSGEFTEKLSDFVCVLFDFGDEKYFQATIPEGLSDKEEKEFKKMRDIKQKQFLVADKFFVKNTPAFIVSNKNGYYVSTVEFDYASPSIDGYVSQIRLEKDLVAEMDNKLNEIEKLSKAKKAKAIDEFVKSQPEMYRTLLVDLYKEIPSLDKNNETGLVSEYIREIANSNAYEYLVKLDFDNAIKCYTDAVEDERNSLDDKQMLYYLAANVCLNNITPDFDKCIELLNQAVSIAPDSDLSKDIQAIISELNKMKDSEVNNK